LYGRDEVELSLVTSLLNKSDKAIFWANELFCSGYKEELCLLLWKVYYDFYATTNPGFEKYLTTKLKAGLDTEHAVCVIVKNFIIRRYNTDVFIVRSIVEQFEIERDDNKGFKDLLVSQDFTAIGSFVLEYIQDGKLAENYKVALEYFVSRGLVIDQKKGAAEFLKNPLRRTMFLSKVIHYFSTLKQIKMGRNLYVQVEETATTLSLYKIPPRKILSIARVYNIDDDNYLSLFKLERETTDMTEAYRDNWLFHASFSPLWKARIESHKGCVNIEGKKVTFDDVDDEERFFEEFNLEPDEQTLEVQQKSTQQIKSERDWLSFYREHKHDGVVDVDEDIIKDIDKLTYYTF
jgi:hypothetical protein